MIDFRYHLVSIVSIFMALAVGIVLGAGPLQGEIGSTLATELSNLREDKARLNAEVADATKTVSSLNDYTESTAPLVVSNQLSDQRVAVVVLPNTDPSVVSALGSALRASGASIVSTTTLAEDWVADGSEPTTRRDTAIGEAADIIGLNPDAGDIDQNQVLAALLAGPRNDGGEDPSSSDITSALTVLVDAKLLSIDAPSTEAADVAVLTTADAMAADPAALQVWLGLANAVDAAAIGTVVAGALTPAPEVGTELTDSLIGAVRADEASAGAVSTVDDITAPLGGPNLVFAVVEQIGGGAGQYGAMNSASAPYAPVPAP